MGISILITIIGFFVGVSLMALISANKINELEELLNTQIKLRQKRDKRITELEAEIKNYNKIKHIIRISEITQEFAVITLNEIKEVITDRKSTNNF